MPGRRARGAPWPRFVLRRCEIVSMQPRVSVAVVEKTPWKGYLVLVIGYGAALGASVLCVHDSPAEWPWLLTFLAAEFAATLVLFGFAVAFDNTALYNAHWSLAPIVVAFWFALGPGAARALDTRQLVVLSVVTFYGVRLTFNWVRSWAGLKHEDWQYSDFREKTGKAFWPVSLLAFHLFPMGLVIAGCLPLHAALVREGPPFGVLDLTGAAVTAGAVVIEWLADEQLRRHRRSGAGGFCTVGLWNWSRHPNYFGEVSVWFGFWVLGVAAGAPWWAAAGWVSMLALFVGASIPMAEKRSLARRPGYADYARRTSVFVPLPPRRG